MEKGFQEQIGKVLGAMQKLVSHCLHRSTVSLLMLFKRGHFERISDRSGQLEKFDDLAKEALKHRNFRYEERRDWKSKPGPPAGGLFRPKPRNSLVLTESTMVDAYNLAGQNKTFLLRLSIL